MIIKQGGYRPEGKPKNPVPPGQRAALDSFQNIHNSMTWKGAALQQVNEFRALLEDLGFQWEIVGHHTSKSIRLPVICISHGETKIYLRDNFHDINICVVSKMRLKMQLSALLDGVLEPKDWEWYLNEIARARGYSWKEWSDEQMNTPGLLALSDDTPWYSIKKPDEKKRWAKRMTDPEWWGKDWAGGEICWEGRFGPDAHLWIQYHAYLEGIEGIVPRSATGPYKRGCKGFAFAVFRLEQAKELIKKVMTRQP